MTISTSKEKITVQNRSVLCHVQKSRHQLQLCCYEKSHCSVVPLIHVREDQRVAVASSPEDGAVKQRKR